jgi:ubiquinone biosynthesis protein COQ4
MKTSELPELARVFWTTLRDSNATEELLIGEELTSISRMEALVPLFTATEEGRSILKDRPVISTRTVDFAALGALPDSTLGGAYVRHLVRCGLDPDALTTPVTRGSQLANYLLMRVRQTHDLWHTMLGLGTTGHEEVLVHAFQWPQLRMPYSAFVVAFGFLKHLVGEGRLAVIARDLPRAHALGRWAQPLLPIRWEWHWEEPIANLRTRLGLPEPRWTHAG